MARAGSFTTTSFNADGGYIVRDISDEIAANDFAVFLRELASMRTIDIGTDAPVDAGVLRFLLAQLREAPIDDGTKQLDVREVRHAVQDIEATGGFRDAWVIGDDDGGRLAGSQGADVMLARDGNDRVVARAGSDFIDGGAGRDVLLGGRGDDRLKGDDGRDVLEGDRGNDTLHGGAGNDTLVGQEDADTFLFTAEDFDSRDTSDVIEDYDAGEGDQIVDLTGTLTVVASGRIGAFDGSGTLLATNDGDRVFVRGAFLTQDDVLNELTEPWAPNRSGGADAAADPYELRVRSVGTTYEGTDLVERFEVTMVNLTTQPIINVADLDVRLIEADDVAVLPDRTHGATYSDGVFDLSGSGPRSVDSKVGVELFGFSVKNRAADIAIDADALRPIGFVPEGPSGPISARASFALDVAVFDLFDDGGSAEVYITNTGTRTLLDLDGLDFAFTETGVRDVITTWGATFGDDTFYVSPWGEGDPHPSIAPGARVKLFGFTFASRAPSEDLVDPSDFTLTSSFEDLLT